MSQSPNVTHGNTDTMGLSAPKSSTLQLRRKSRAGSEVIHKFPRSIIQKHRSFMHPLLVDGVDCTPHALNPFVSEKTKERQLSTVKDHTTSQTILGSIARMESVKFKAEILQQHRAMEQETTRHRSLLTVVCDDVFMGERDSATPKSAFSITDHFESLRESHEPVKEIPIPDHVSLILKETETEFLLDMPSSSVFKESSEADAVEENNRQYEFLTSAKGRNRKVIEVGLQTIPIVMKARDVDGPRNICTDKEASVSNWEMYDVYEGKKEESEHEDEGDEKRNTEHDLKDLVSEDSLQISAEDNEIVRLVKNRRFFDAVLIMERLLANNEYNWEQKRYKGLAEPNPFRENVQYKYRLNLLWTFVNESTAGTSVAALCVNTLNDDIVAVGYGKYHPEESTPGLVAIWNIKNPVQPEKLYKYPDSVTSLDFAKMNPNVLAVGFYNGAVKILDISKWESTIIAKDKSSFDPVWELVWYSEEQTIQEGEGDELIKEHLLAGFDDGRVIKYTLMEGSTLRGVQIMRTCRCDGKLKGINISKCRPKETTIQRFAAANCITIHPKQPHMYMIGTAEGVVYKCSTLYLNKHLGTVQTHDGAVTTLVYSPFVNCISISCGNDFTVRFWMDGLTEPLIESTLEMKSLSDVSWSPSHSTIVATISGMTIHVFDMQRKLYEPQSQTMSPTRSFNTVCKFSPNGRSLLVGDKSGNVHVFSLEDLPLPAFFQANLLFESFKAITIVAKPELKKKFYKVARSYGQKSQKKMSEYFS